MNVDLKDVEWGEFDLKEVFSEIQRGKRLKKNDHQTGETPYISASAISNGVDAFIGNKEKIRLFENCLTVANSGSVGATFYQPFAFVASDHVTKLKNTDFSKYVYLFISFVVERLGQKYSFNREINDQRIQREKIVLPVNKSGKPNFSFMDQFMRRKEQMQLERYYAHVSTKLKLLKDFEAVPPLSEKKWGEFFISEVATVISGRDIYEAERVHGDIPYISATALNNGIGYFVANKNETLESNCLSVNRNGSVGYSFYHPYQGLFSNDCRKLRLKHNSEFVGLFISRVITHQKEKYGYGYKMGTARIKRQKILLPINVQCEPDYVYMENYIKKLEFTKLSEYARKKELPILQ